ncbi:MAG TPA: hypothetical protein PKI76_07810 [Oscillospiraceae bacterium]|nr:hypothetical protein [Oscillospiraceae bacterium]
MKKVIALALALVMVLAMGVTSFAITFVEGDIPTLDDGDFGFTYFQAAWDVNNESVIVVPFDIGDCSTLINGTDAADELGFDDGATLSSIKVETEKGIVDVTVYKLADYAKSVDGTTVKTKSSWPFEDFDLQDLVTLAGEDDAFTDGELDLFFLYLSCPTYAGAKVSTDNYFTLKFRENTTGADDTFTSKKVWICVYPFAVFDEDVETYADEDEAMEFVDGYALIGETIADVWDFVEETYELDDDILDDDHVWIVDLVADGDDGFELGTDVPTVITKDAWKEIVGSTLIVSDGDDLEVEIGKIVKGQTSINFITDDDVDDDVQAINEDAELAALLFLDTTNVLDSDFTISYTFEIEDAAKAGDYFLYELVGDELKLVKKVAVGKGDDEVDVEIERKAGDTLGQYYLSDVELATAAAEEEPEENPNTGASEVAGVAVALAVISLVSAAAVSLKK